ncbi:MAG: rhodanese-like domain-containing protein [Gammaproteobacteria bacterium]|nr:rhodanese-like domain-containing protein [Gammaproteobacteria bacterium]
MPEYLAFFHQHPLLFAALAAVLALLLANEIHGALNAGTRVSTLDAVRLINDRNALILDVRPPAEFKKGHLLGALNMPLARLADHAGELGKDRQRPVLVYCGLGSAAAEAAKKLRALGFAEVYPLRGGINNWLASNLPVTAK